MKRLKNILFLALILLAFISTKYIPITKAGMSHPVLDVTLTTAYQEFSQYILTGSATLEYQIPVWYSVSVSDKRHGIDKNYENPYNKIYICASNGSIISTVVNIGRNSSKSGMFYLNAGQGILAQAYTGAWSKWDHTGDRIPYTCHINIDYQLDETPPNTPNAPRVYEGVVKGDVCFTKYNDKMKVILEWDAVTDRGTVYNGYTSLSGIKHYNIYNSQGALILSGIKPVAGQNIISAEIDGSNFPPGQECGVKIQTVDIENNVSAFSPITKVIVDNIPPMGPTILTTPTTNGCTNADPVVWTWDQASDTISGVKQYRITIKDKETGVIQEAFVPAGTTSYSRSGLADLKTYECTVRAEDNVGNLSEPVTQTVKIIRTVPKVTLPAYPIKSENGNITFTWNPVSDADRLGINYQVGITESTTPPGTVQTVSGNSKQFGVYSSRKAWYLWVRAVNPLENHSDWTMAGPFPDFTINGPENGQVIDEPTLKITVSARTAGKDFRYIVRYQSEAEVLETSETGAGIETTIELPFEANWKWWLEVAEYQNGAKIPESIVVTEPFHLRFDRNNSTVTSRGALYENEIWWSGVHYITGDVIVPEGLTLTIEPDTQVISIANSGSKPALIIKGEMTAGTGSSFTVSTDATGDWQGILVEGGASLTGATIRHAERGVAALDGSDVTLIDCIFENNLAGVHAYNSTPAISGSLFQNNVYGIKEDEGGKPVAQNCRFMENGIDYYHRILTEISMEQLNGIEGNEGNTK